MGKIVDETAMLAYRAKLERWEENEERNKNTFTITEADLKKDEKKQLKKAVRQTRVISNKGGWK